jgi:transcriptional regulator with GAF, ATPase, and Fis domain
MRALERANLMRALERAGWRIAGPGGAARLLGLPPSTVASRMRALDIRRPTD